MKKALVFIGIIALFAIMASCTPAGAELGLVGTWEATVAGFKTTVEIKNDDTYKFTGRISGIDMSISGKIIKADSIEKTVTVEIEGV
jgi:hypothetical protein